jgi:Fe-S cluster assembly protein SufD
MYNKPELEIFADDVVCGHGATVGQLDEDQIFYLMARGIPRAQAEGMIIEGFAREVLEFVDDEAIRERLGESLSAWLARRAS